MSIPHDEHLIIGSPLIRSMSCAAVRPERPIRRMEGSPLVGEAVVLHFRRGDVWRCFHRVDMGWRVRFKRQNLEGACGRREKIPDCLQAV